MSEATQVMNPLGTAPIGKTLAKFAIPAIISNLITSMEFAVSLMQIYLFFTFVNGCQPISANAFPALGKPLKGVCVSLFRPLLFLIPLFLRPKFMGIGGVACAGLIADGITFLFASVMWIMEFKKMPKQQVNQ